MPDPAPIEFAPLWHGAEPLLLASRSATRLALLVGAGLPVETRSSGVDERALEAGMANPTLPAHLARGLARAKALAVARQNPNRIVLGGDQVLSLDGRPLAKPASAGAAREQLARLSGRRHLLHSAAALVVDDVVEMVEAEAALTLRDLTAGEIDGYVARRPDGSWSESGLYQVEGLGQHLVARIEGDHATILGLPMLALLATLRSRGLIGL